MAHPRSARTHARPRPRTNWILWTLVAILLLAVLVGTIWVPIYNRTSPALGSWPFFYWYQLLWVPAVALVSWCAYLLSRRAMRGTAPGGTVAAPPPGPGPLSAPPAAASSPGAAPQGGPSGPVPGPQAGPAAAPPPPLPKRQVPRRPEAD
jgi:uncharacterized protein DUF3311